MTHLYGLMTHFISQTKHGFIKNRADGLVLVYLSDILFMVLQSFVRHQ